MQSKSLGRLWGFALFLALCLAWCLCLIGAASEELTWVVPEYLLSAEAEQFLAESIFPEFEEMHNTSVRLLSVPYQELMSILESGEVDLVSSSRMMWPLVESGMIRDLSGLLPEVDNEIPEQLMALGVFPNPETEEFGLFYLPFTVFTRFLYYRSDLFKEHDISPPRTLGELIEVARALKDIQGCAQLALPAIDAHGIVEEWVLSSGGDPASFEDDGSSFAYAVFEQLVSEDLIRWTFNPSESKRSFISGECLMMVDYDYVYSSLATNLPYESIGIADSFPSRDVEVEIPNSMNAQEPGVLSSAIATLEAHAVSLFPISIATISAKADLAWKLANFLLSRGTQKRLLDGIPHFIPIHPDALSNLRPMLQTAIQNTLASPALSLSNSPIPYAREILDLMRETVNSISKGLTSAVQALRNAAQKVRQWLATNCSPLRVFANNAGAAWVALPANVGAGRALGWSAGGTFAAANGYANLRFTATAYVLGNPSLCSTCQQVKSTNVIGGVTLVSNAAGVNQFRPPGTPGNCPSAGGLWCPDNYTHPPIPFVFFRVVRRGIGGFLEWLDAPGFINLGRASLPANRELEFQAIVTGTGGTRLIHQWMMSFAVANAGGFAAFAAGSQLTDLPR